MNRPLYNIHPVGSRELNMMAHPGGGTEVNEVPSFEGLVEDQFEAHLRHLEIAYKEPTAVRMAQLARELESFGFDKTAANIDSMSFSFMNKVAQEIDMEVLRKGLLRKLAEVEKIVRQSKLQMFGLEGLSGAEDFMLNTLSEIAMEVDSNETNWTKVITGINKLLDEDLLYGSWSQVGETDLESYMGASDFRTYKRELELMRDAAMAARGSLERKQTSPQRSLPADPEVATRQESAQMLHNFAKKVYETLADLNSNAKTIVSLKGNKAAERINLIFGNPDLQAQLRDFYTRFKELEELQSGSGLTEMQYRQYAMYLQDFYKRVQELEAFVEKVGSE